VLRFLLPRKKTRAPIYINNIKYTKEMQMAKEKKIQRVRKRENKREMDKKICIAERCRRINMIRH